MKQITRRFLETLFFFLVMFLSFYTIFKGQDIAVIWTEIAAIPMRYMILICLLVPFFLIIEGLMFYVLFRPLDSNATFIRCVKYSFIGFFYSSITPSASGGQPMQLVYMKKDGCSISYSVLILICLALISKIVLSLMGISLLVFIPRTLFENMGMYTPLFFLGFLFIILWTVFLICLIAFTQPMEKLALKYSHKIFGKNQDRDAKFAAKIQEFFQKYNNSRDFFGDHFYRIFFVFILGILQKMVPLTVTVLVYRGLGISELSVVKIMMMQAAITVTVDMLPLPGGQGIYELIYRTVFKSMVPATSIMSSLYVSRGVNFYYLLLISALIVAVSMLIVKIRRRKDAAVAESDAEIVAGLENQ